MIKINVICVGKIKEKYFVSAVEEYVKRLSRFCKLSLIEVKEENFVSEPDKAEIEIIKRKEGLSIIEKIKGTCVLADIGGSNFSSEEFAEFIGDFVDKGQEVTFVIGGSYGVSDDVKQRSNKKLSFSKMTFPHTMFRVMLLEQIYRAFKIKENGRYHK